MPKTVTKCIKVYSEKLNEDMFLKLSDLFDKYGKCRAYFYQRYSGIESMLKVQSPKELRTILSREGNIKVLMDTYNILSRYVVMSLFDACANINASWTLLSKKLKTKVRENENLSIDEKNYLNYILSIREFWYQVLKGKEPFIKNKKITKTLEELKSKIDENRFHYLHNYLKRITRKHKFKFKFSNKERRQLNSISLDQEMYSIIENENDTFISFMSDIKNNRILLKLRSKYYYRKNGNVQLILNRPKKCCEIHKMIQVKTKPNNYKNVIGGCTSNTIGKCTLNTIGVDKGYSTLLSCSDDKEYGKDIGEKFTKESDRINKRNTNRNYFIQKHKNLKIELEKLNPLIIDTIKEKNEIYLFKLLKEKRNLLKQIEHIKNNLGNNLYTKQHEKAISNLEKEINYSIKQMIKESNAKKIVKEDLSFTKDKKKKENKGARFNRNMSNWLKGFLNKRIEYIAGINNIEYFDVNPAYTSQFCSNCGAKIIKRKGKHSEIAICPNCNEINANTNAAKNILARLDDKEITLYTPYKKVNEILLNRYHK